MLNTWKESLNGDGKKFHKYQQNEQIPLTSNNQTQKWPLHPGPGLGQA